jgi:chemotaxis-related protein WspB
MVMLLFYLGEERYACDCDSVVEVVPRIPLKIVAHAPPYLAGLMRYTGLLMPVLDFAQLRDGRPSENWMSTRIVVLQNSTDIAQRQLMGMIAERLTETIPQEPKDFSQHNMSFRNVPYLTGVYGDDHGVIQLVDTAQLFPIVHNIFSEVP